MENTKENIVKVLEKIIECDRRLVNESSNEVAKQIYTQDIIRIQDVIRFMTDQKFFEGYWELFVENPFSKALFEKEEK